MNSFCSQFHCR